MPAAAATTTDQPAASAKPAGSRRRLWIWALAAVLVTGAAGAGGWWWWQAQQEDPEAQDAPARTTRLPAQYISLEPAFVVNLADSDASRYLQADVQVVTRDPATVAALDAHLPSVRNRLLLLFGQQEARQLAQRAGKERLQEVARDEVRALLRAEGAADRVEAVIFTSLVTQ